MDRWRELPDPNAWGVTPETARLLTHWRSHRFGDIRPFFCQVEAVETAIWLTEVAPTLGKAGRRFLDQIDAASAGANPGLARLALKLATGAGKTIVMAMIIAWQTINAVRRPGSRRFTRGFLVVTPGVTIRDRLRVLQPNDPDSYYASRELAPSDMLRDLERGDHFRWPGSWKAGLPAKRTLFALWLKRLDRGVSCSMPDRDLEADVLEGVVLRVFEPTRSYLHPLASSRRKALP